MWRKLDKFFHQWKCRKTRRMLRQQKANISHVIDGLIRMSTHSCSMSQFSLPHLFSRTWPCSGASARVDFLRSYKLSSHASLMQFELHEFAFCESQASALRFIKFEILFVFRFALTRELCAAVTNDDFFLFDCYGKPPLHCAGLKFWGGWIHRGRQINLQFAGSLIKTTGFNFYVNLQTFHLCDDFVQNFDLQFHFKIVQPFLYELLMSQSKMNKFWTCWR